MKENYDLMLEGLLKEKELLLKSNPELQTFQDEIDLILESEGDDAISRCKKLIGMLMHKMQFELLPARYHLNRLKNKVEYMSNDKIEEVDLNEAISYRSSC